MSILVIDDEPAVLNALTLLLKAIGYDAHGINDPKEAVEFIASQEANSVELVLCDLRMPDLSGLEVCMT